VHGVARAVYFNRATILHPERLAGDGPALYLLLHRNGAVDGFVYHRWLPRVEFMISTQLRRNPLAWIFFGGIEVVRASDDGDRTSNEAALDVCADHLAAGGELAVFPEGTSQLGPRHLPFKGGAARIALKALDRGVAFRVIPLGIAYERGWAFRSNVEVLVGHPINLTLEPGLPEGRRLRILRDRFEAGLEAVGVNVETEERQREIEAVSYVTTLGTPRSYTRALKTLEQTGTPAPLGAAWADLDAAARARHLARYHGVPLFPLKPWVVYAAALVPLALVTGLAIVLNLPPWLLAGWAGRRFPDGPNVVTLWRMLVGLPVFALWAVAVLAAAWWSGRPLVAAGWGLVTVFGLLAYHRVKKLAVAVRNAWTAPGLSAAAAAFHAAVLAGVPEAGV